MRQVLESGTTKVHEYRRGRRRAAAGSTRSPRRSSASRTPTAEPLGVCSVSVDVTESRRARERLAMLSEASTRIGSTLDVMQTGQELADLAVPLLADYVAVDLAESVPLGEGPSGPDRHRRAGAARACRRAGLASIHPGVPGVPVGARRAVFVPPASPFAGSCARAGPTSKPSWTPLRAPGSTRTRRGRRRSATNGMHSLMVVPIRARRAVLGVAAVRPHRGPGAVPGGRPAAGRGARRRAALAWTTPAATPASTPRPSPCSAACCPQRLHGRHGGRGRLALPAADMRRRRRRRLVRRDPAVRRPGRPRRRRRRRPRHQRRRDHGHGCAPPYTPSPTWTCRPTNCWPTSTTWSAASTEEDADDRGPAAAVRRRHLPVRRLRPGHPAVHHGPRRTPAARVVDPRRHASPSPTCPPGPPLGLGRPALRGRRARTARGQPARPLHRRPDRGPRPRHRRRACDRLRRRPRPARPAPGGPVHAVRRRPAARPRTADDVALLLARTRALGADQVASWDAARATRPPSRSARALAAAS